ncbi:hypothetical protein KM043_010075 [Ampulex compressa]|nr:hypothetical protein KM043_010075 [Ampulex compressa]
MEKKDSIEKNLRGSASYPLVLGPPAAPWALLAEGMPSAVKLLAQSESRPGQTLVVIGPGCGSLVPAELFPILLFSHETADQGPFKARRKLLAQALRLVLRHHGDPHIPASVDRKRTATPGHDDFLVRIDDPRPPEDATKDATGRSNRRLKSPLPACAGQSV